MRGFFYSKKELKTLSSWMECVCFCVVYAQQSQYMTLKIIHNNVQEKHMRRQLDAT